MSRRKNLQSLNRDISALRHALTAVEKEWELTFTTEDKRTSKGCFHVSHMRVRGRDYCCECGQDITRKVEMDIL
jgi:hypothetical protein